MNIIFSFKVIFSVIWLTRLINYSEKVDPSCFDIIRYMYSTALPYLFCFSQFSKDWETRQAGIILKSSKRHERLWESFFLLTFSGNCFLVQNWCARQSLAYSLLTSKYKDRRIYFLSQAVYLLIKVFFTPQINSVYSFSGCLSNLQLNGRSLTSASQTFSVTPCFEGPSEAGTYFSSEGGYVVLGNIMLTKSIPK